MMLPTLDLQTVVSLTAVNLLIVATAMTLAMGRQLSRAARLARGSLVAQAAGWGAMVASEAFWDMPMSVLAMVCGAASGFLMYRALESWLGPRPLRRTMLVTSVLMPLGYALSFEHYAVRVGWANLWLAAQLGIVATAALWPSDRVVAQPSWQRLLALCYGCTGVLTAARGILGAWFTPLYPHFLAPHPANIAAQVVANVSMALTLMAVFMAWRREVEVRLEQQADTDPLTGLLNRRGWDQQAQHTLALARRNGWSVGVLMLDLDHFKRVNDVYGHDMGDRVLRVLSRAIQSSLRETDLSARLGGEEFVLLLPRISQANAEALDQRLRTTLGRMCADELQQDINFSSGLAFCDLSQTDALKTALDQADEALYQAKASGRGHLCTAPDTPLKATDTATT
jgi:diguanylate cyclase (GGDEF)-like protein